jgi:hypothetical protein
MKIEDKTLKIWKLKRKQGTITHIQKLTGISRMTLTKAFNGEGNEKIINIINEYFIKEDENEQKRNRRKKQLF